MSQPTSDQVMDAVVDAEATTIHPLRRQINGLSELLSVSPPQNHPRLLLRRATAQLQLGSLQTSLPLLRAALEDFRLVTVLSTDIFADQDSNSLSRNCALGHIGRCNTIREILSIRLDEASNPQQEIDSALAFVGLAFQDCENVLRGSSHALLQGAYLARSRLWILLGNFQGAEEDFEAIIRLGMAGEEIDPMMWLLRGENRLRLESGDGSDMEETEERTAVEDVDPNEMFSRAEADFTSGIQVWDAREQKEKGSQDRRLILDLLRQRSIVNAALQQFDHGIADLTRALSVVEEVTDQEMRLKEREQFLLGRGCAYAEMGRMIEAVDDFEMAFAETRSPYAAYNAGIALVGVSRFRDAIERLSETIRQIPDHAEAYTHRAEAYLGLATPEAREKAVADLDEFVKLDDGPAGYVMRAGALFDAKRYGDALADCDRVVDVMHPPPSKVLVMRVGCLSSLGLVEEALSSLDEAIHSVCERDPDAFYARARLLLETNDLHRAIEDFTECIRLDPRRSAAFHNRGCCHFSHGDHRLAESDFTEANRLDPTDWAPLASRAFVRYLQGDLKSALMDNEISLQLQTTSEACLARFLYFCVAGRPEEGIPFLTTAHKLDDRMPFLKTILSQHPDSVEDLKNGIARLLEGSNDVPAYLQVVQSHLEEFIMERS